MVAIVTLRAIPPGSSSLRLLVPVVVVFMLFQTSSVRAAASTLLAGNIPKHALALRPPATISSWSSRGRIAATTTPATGSPSKSLAVMAGAIDAEPCTTSRPIFLDNNRNEWVRWDTDHDDSSAAGNNSSSSKLHLEKLSLQQLRQQAQQQGQTSTGSKKQLVERLLCQEPPGNNEGRYCDTTDRLAQKDIIPSLEDICRRPRLLLYQYSTAKFIASMLSTSAAFEP